MPTKGQVFIPLCYSYLRLQMLHKYFKLEVYLPTVVINAPLTWCRSVTSEGQILLMDTWVQPIPPNYLNKDITSVSTAKVNCFLA